ncbi:MAG: hypothetical protein C4563_06445 [Desulfobulbus sp.]|jgi:hypothetical protein|nr:MAG: hypothetical protein C4563_06445 [Desulfobulbus sp.]
MKTLLAAIKAALQTGIAEARDGDIFITPSLNFLPAGVKSTLAIGIKDGPVARRDLTCGLVEKTLQVQVGVFVRLLKPEAAVMGDDSTSSLGVLEAIDAIETTLTDNLLSIPGMMFARPVAEAASELFVGEGGAAWQTKSITYNYIWEG